MSFKETNLYKSGNRTVKKETKNEKDLEQKTSATKDEAKAGTQNEPAPKVTKVGAMLKEVRQKKGVKLSDVSKVLCIRKFYLEAIESSDYETVPAFPYGIGFIRSYANYLGLNSENIVELYKEETNASLSKDIRVLEPQQEASMPGTKYLVISLLAIFLVYGGWALFNNGNEQPLDEEILPEQTTESNDTGVIVVEEFNFEQAESSDTISGEADEIAQNQNSLQSPASAIQPSVSENADDADDKNLGEAKQEKNAAEEKTAEAVAEKIVIPESGIFIEVLKETWVEVKDDIKLYLSKVLQAGDTYKVPDKRGMILSVGKNDGVNVYINGKLTQVVRPNKKMNIALDGFLEATR